MERRFIARIYDHYFDKKADRVDASEFRDAFKRFFREEGFLRDERLGLFNEWLLFDHPMRSPDGVRETLLARWIRENPYQIGSTQMGLYRAMAEENIYGWFEIVEVHMDRGLVLKCLADDAIYDVSEKSGTHGAVAGMVLVARVGRFDDHYELIGSDGTVLPEAPKGRALEDFKKRWRRDPWTPLHTERILRSRNGADLVEDLQDPEGDENAIEWYAHHPEDVDVVIERMLRNQKLERHVSVALVRTWAERAISENEISHAGGLSPISTPFRLLLGLLREEAGRDDVREVLGAYSLLLSSIAYRKREHLTPYELHKEQRDGGEGGFSIECTHAMEWARHMHNGILHMKMNKYRDACNEYEEAFRLLLEGQTTFREPFRLFANYGVACAAAGDPAVGVRLVELACTLNPNYPFARDTLSFLKKEHPEHAKGAELPHDAYEKNAGLRYYAWIDQWGIDFSTAHVARARRAILSDNKKKRQ